MLHLGGMLELGPKEIMFHELILQHCLDARIDLMALVGKRFLTAAENLNIGKGKKLVVLTMQTNLFPNLLANYIAMTLFW